jgi:hypothetical protein
MRSVNGNKQQIRAGNEKRDRDRQGSTAGAAGSRMPERGHMRRSLHSAGA